MSCFDYEEVECFLCNTKTQDGFVEFDGKIACDGCVGKLKEVLDWYYLNSTGYRKINAGYAEARIDDIDNGTGGIIVKGHVKYGKQDVGDGGVEHSDSFAIAMKKDGDNYKIINGGVRK